MIEGCEHEKQLVCDAEVCATCYYGELISSKDRAKNVELEVVYSEDKHRKVVRKKKNVLHRTNVSTV